MYFSPSRTARVPSAPSGFSFRSSAFRSATAITLPLVLSGCQNPITRWTRPACEFKIDDHRDPARVHPYTETFDEAYYDMDAHGNVNVVLRRVGSPLAGGGGGEVNQTVRIRTVWRSIPGRTVSHKTHINAIVGYFITGGRIGDSFEGAGSVLFAHDRRTDTIEGTLDQAVLRPRRQLTAGEPVFPHAELSGRFTAVRDRRRVVQMVNELDRTFGPLPRPDAVSHAKP